MRVPELIALSLVFIDVVVLSSELVADFVVAPAAQSNAPKLSSPQAAAPPQRILQLFPARNGLGETPSAEIDFNAIGLERRLRTTRVWISEKSEEKITTLRESDLGSANRAGSDILGNKIKNWKSSITQALESMSEIQQRAESAEVSAEALQMFLNERFKYHGVTMGNRNWGLRGRDSKEWNAVHKSAADLILMFMQRLEQGVNHEQGLRESPHTIMK
jgi:hypothetical protein